MRGHEITVLIKEVFKPPSQATSVSFPARYEPKFQTPEYRADSLEPYRSSPATKTARDGFLTKDWSSDDTEPGDDEVFNPILHKMTDTTDVNSKENMSN